MATPRLGLVVEDKPTELSCSMTIHVGMAIGDKLYACLLLSCVCYVGNYSSQCHV